MCLNIANVGCIGNLARVKNITETWEANCNGIPAESVHETPTIRAANNKNLPDSAGQKGL